jgi:arginyl-tRNA synthetase
MNQEIIKQLFKHLNIDKQQLNSMLETPPSPELGDYAFPCFTLAKTLKKSPNEIAQDLAKKIVSKEFEKVEAKGPYVNFFLNKQKITEQTLSKILKERDKYGSQKIKEKSLVETPGPNTNKPLHIGHARNIILGQALQRLLQFAGNDVKLVNINNDRGVHICKSMLAYDKFGSNETPESQGKKSDHLVGDFYVKFAQEAKDNPSLEEEAQEYLKKWESGDKKVLETWKKMNVWALNGFKETYKKFNLKIDKEYYESKIYKNGKEIILDQLKKGVVKKKEDGTVYIDLSDQGFGEKVLLRADGTSIYITFDIYLAVQRKKEFKFDKMFYVVANEQNYHFNVLFTLLKLFGYRWADKLVHYNYGLVHLESGRMKSREGTVVDSDDLIAELESLAGKEIETRFPELPEKEKSSRAEKIALAALRYYFLKVERGKDMMFKPEESINFEGNTGPYLLYTYARAKSILRKANYKKKPKLKIPELEPSEKVLLTQLALFPEIVTKAYESLAPNLVANYAYQLAQSFNEFYHANKVIGSEKVDFRLALVDASSQVLKNSLNILAIETLENM